MYQLFLDGVLLPVTPEKFELKTKNANKTMTLISGMEINFLKEAGLSEIKFDVLIPSVQYSFARYEDGFKSPAFFTNHFETLKTSKKPFQLVMVRQFPDGKALFNNNISVSMESYTITEQAKDGFDLTVSIELKQYNHYGTKIVTVTNNVATVTKQRETNKAPKPKQETTYTVKKGDTLWNIAKKFYGNGSKYTKIYEANKDKITNPNVISVGLILVIPSA